VPHNDPVPHAVADHWNDLLADTRATAGEYRDRGWDVLVLHTADVTVVDEGLSVLVPDNEYDDLAALAEQATFDNSRVFATAASGYRFLLIVVEATGRKQAVAVPAYLSLDDEPKLREQANERGVLSTRVRALSADSHVTFAHEDPSIFFSE